MTAIGASSSASLYLRSETLWGVVSRRHKEGVQELKWGMRNQKGGAAPHYDALARALTCIL